MMWFSLDNICNKMILVAVLNVIPIDSCRLIFPKFVPSFDFLSLFSICFSQNSAYFLCKLRIMNNFVAIDNNSSITPMQIGRQNECETPKKCLTSNCS